MREVITYVKNTKDFIEELEKIAPDQVINGQWEIAKTLVIRSENGTLALSRLSEEQENIITGMVSVQSLGTYDELFANEDAMTLYKSVHPYDTEQFYEDEAGNKIGYFLPQKIGEFA